MLSSAMGLLYSYQRATNYFARLFYTPTTMRVIEEKMTSAISNRIDWKSGNTSVQYNQETGASIVHLYGNKIAEIYDDAIRLFDGGHQTTTTKSRINAILSTFGLKGERVFAKNFDWFVQQDGGPIPFFDGMRLN